MNDDARQLHDESIIIDGLNASWFPDVRVLRSLLMGGITAVNATVAAWHDPAGARQQLDMAHGLFVRHDDIIMQVETATDILEAKKRHRVGMILGFQDTSPLGDEVSRLQAYHEQGVRAIQLTYNARNRVGYGCQEPDDRGLSEFGRAVVREMNRLGILIDVSHCGPRTSREAVDASEKPIAITHANPAARADHPRNKSDALIKAVAKRGGVIGAVALAPMLTGRYRATLDDYLDTISYLVDLVGIDHVGLGSDFMEAMPLSIRLQASRGLPLKTIIEFALARPTQGFESAAAFPNVTAGLLARGYRPEDVRKVMGGNWWRLYAEVWH